MFTPILSSDDATAGVLLLICCVHGVVSTKLGSMTGYFACWLSLGLPCVHYVRSFRKGVSIKRTEFRTSPFTFYVLTWYGINRRPHDLMNDVTGPSGPVAIRDTTGILKLVARLLRSRKPNGCRHVCFFS